MPDNHAPIPQELPEPIRTLKWIMQCRPRNLNEWSLLALVSFLALDASVVVVNENYEAYKHSKHLRQGAFAMIETFKIYMGNEVAKESFWYDPLTDGHPKLPAVPNPLDNPMDMIAATYTAPVVIKLPAGSRSGGYGYTAPVEI